MNGRGLGMCNFCFRPAVNRLVRRNGPIRRVLDLPERTCVYCDHCLGNALNYVRRGGWRRG